LTVLFVITIGALPKEQGRIGIRQIRPIRGRFDRFESDSTDSTDSTDSIADSTDSMSNSVRGNKRKTLLFLFCNVLHI